MVDFKRIILITIDCLRADHVGCIGSGNLTPNIDKLAKDSIVFTKAFANGPGTNQSFPAILTSTYFLMHGGMRLLSRYITLAEVLSNHGFKTAAFHSNPFLSHSFGWNKGFHEFYDFLDVLKSPSAAVTRSDFSAKATKFLNKMIKILGKGNVKSFLRRFYYRWMTFEMPYIEGDMLNKHVIAWIHKNKKEKFFLWTHYMDPHRPYIPPFSYLNQFNTRKEAFIFDTLVDAKIDQGKVSREELVKLKKLYGGEVRFVDYCIGNLIEFLNVQGLMEDSLLIITSDHGEAFMEHGKLTHAYDIVYNELIHVPLLFYGITDYAATINEYVQLLDITPTILNVLDVKKPRSFLGNSLIPVSEGKLQHKPIFSESAKPDLINLTYDKSKKVISCIVGDWKLVINELWGTTELYDMKKDFHERNNLVENELEVRKKLSAIIQAHLDSEVSYKLKFELKALKRKTLKNY